MSPLGPWDSEYGTCGRGGDQTANGTRTKLHNGVQNGFGDGIDFLAFLFLDHGYDIYPFTGRPCTTHAIQALRNCGPGLSTPTGVSRSGNLSRLVLTLWSSLAGFTEPMVPIRCILCHFLRLTHLRHSWYSSSGFDLVVCFSTRCASPQAFLLH